MWVVMRAVPPFLKTIFNTMGGTLKRFGISWCQTSKGIAGDRQACVNTMMRPDSLDIVHDRCWVRRFQVRIIGREIGDTLVGHVPGPPIHVRIDTLLIAVLLERFDEVTLLLSRDFGGHSDHVIDRRRPVATAAKIIGGIFSRLRGFGNRFSLYERATRKRKPPVSG